MDVYTKIKDYLDNHKIAYREIKHTPGASAEEYHNALGCRYEQQLKCLLLKLYTDEGDQFIILTVPAQKRADLDLIKNITKAKKVRMATKEELKEITGCNFGELPPLANAFNIKLFMDKDFLNEEEVFMNAGRVDMSFVVNPKDLEKLENPTII